MRGFNKAIIMGNLVRDPEIRYTTAGRPVASFSVAVNHVWREQGGQLKEEADFIPVIVWGSTAEFCERNFRKGDGILVEGRISVRSFETKTGEKRYATEIIASGVQFTGNAPRQYQDDATSGYQTQPQQHQQSRTKNYRYTPYELERAGMPSGADENELPF